MQAKANFNPRRHTLFIPKNIEKYCGRMPIILRSKYERSFAEWCDRNDKITQWECEGLPIPYYHPIKRKIVNYWPDFIIHINNKVIIIELKPEIQTKSPKHSKRKSLLNEQATYLVNKAKWDAAKSYCDKFGFGFMVIKNESLMK
jgi:hypothetical protein